MGAIQSGLEQDSFRRIYFLSVLPSQKKAVSGLFGKKKKTKGYNLDIKIAGF